MHFCISFRWRILWNSKFDCRLFNRLIFTQNSRWIFVFIEIFRFWPKSASQEIANGKKKKEKSQEYWIMDVIRHSCVCVCVPLFWMLVGNRSSAKVFKWTKAKFNVIMMIINVNIMNTNWKNGVPAAQRESVSWPGLSDIIIISWEIIQLWSGFFFSSFQVRRKLSKDITSKMSIAMHAHSIHIAAILLVWRIKCCIFIELFEIDWEFEHRRLSKKRRKKERNKTKKKKKTLNQTAAAAINCG